MSLPQKVLLLHKVRSFLLFCIEESNLLYPSYRLRSRADLEHASVSSMFEALGFMSNTKERKRSDDVG